MAIRITVNIQIGNRRPSAERIKDTLRAIYKKRGYLVVATKPGLQYELGETIDAIYGMRLGGLFLVDKYTSAREYATQTRMIAKALNQRITPGLLSPSDLASCTFYRVLPQRRKRALKKGAA